MIINNDLPSYDEVVKNNIQTEKDKFKNGYYALNYLSHATLKDFRYDINKNGGVIYIESYHHYFKDLSKEALSKVFDLIDNFIKDKGWKVDRKKKIEYKSGSIVFDYIVFHIIPLLDKVNG
jgi:hypothetical protein